MPVIFLRNAQKEQKMVLEEIRMDLSKAFCILLCWTRYTNLHQFSVEFYEVLCRFVELRKMKFGSTKGFVGIYQETSSFIKCMIDSNAELHSKKQLLWISAISGCW